MKKALSILSKSWHTSALVVAIICLVCFFTLMIPNQYIFQISIYLPLTFILFSILTGVLKAYNNKIKQGLKHVLLTIIIGCVWFFCASLFILYGANDFFADNLKIPNDIECEIPRAYPFLNQKVTPGSSENRENFDFELSHSFQTGIFFYELWISELEPGEVFLRSYEVTKNIPLSTKSLAEESRLEIREFHSDIKYYRLFNDFMIVEGDWGKPYCARFEIWHKNSRTKQEKLLFKKNYIIEGWQR